MMAETFTAPERETARRVVTAERDRVEREDMVGGEKGWRRERKWRCGELQSTSTRGRGPPRLPYLSSDRTFRALSRYSAGRGRTAAAHSGRDTHSHHSPTSLSHASVLHFLLSPVFPSHSLSLSPFSNSSAHSTAHSLTATPLATAARPEARTPTAAPPPQQQPHPPPPPALAPPRRPPWRVPPQFRTHRR